MKPHIAFERALREQVSAIRDATPGVCAGNVRALHAWRVAVRRQRTLLRALPGKPARAIGSGALRNEWRDWSLRLGPVRDADVWDETLHDPALRCVLEATDEGQAFLRAQQCRRNELRAPLRRLLRSTRYVRLLHRTETLIARDLPPALGTLCAGKLARRVGHAFSRLLNRARNGARHLSEADDREAAVHALRRQVRRARYLSEIGRTILPAVSHKMRLRLLQVQTALGKVHDADVQLALLGTLPPDAAQRVRGRIRLQRTTALRQFRKRWRALLRSI